MTGSGNESGGDPADQQIETAILVLLAQRAPGATVCPSEVARALDGGRDDGGESWRSLMAPVREAAVRLVARGEVVVTQGGTVVDPGNAKGPIRLRRAT